jgi:two-component system, NtrC family, response regulator AtoC
MPEPQHVLIVDDSVRMVGLLERLLKRAGFHVTGVTTIQKALEALATQATDWVLTDLMLPTGDGMDILAYVRARQPQAKVIVMTAFGSETTRQRTLTLGAHAFLSKPFSSQALLDLLTRPGNYLLAPTPPSTAEPSTPSADGDASPIL